MPKKSLASILSIQWWLHTFFTSLFFIAMTFFFLFAIEDYFNEKQLVELSNIIAINPSIEGIPAYIQMYSADSVPAYWAKQLEQAPLNDGIEIDNQYGDVIHLVRTKFHNSEDVFVLALDTSKTNAVWDIVDKLLILILPWIIIFLVLASFLAKKFTGQLQNHFKRLLTSIEKSGSPDVLTQFSEAQPISELAQFGRLFAQVWRQKAEILTREKQSLEYLSHELRTPIQSSQATLELLALKTEDQTTIDRLMRSLNRMTRLSNAILYLMESEKLPSTYQVDVIDVCQQLVDELKPLAEVKNQSFIINKLKHAEAKIAPVKIVATREVVETLVSILLTNALQHGNNSPIMITINHQQVCIENEMPLQQSSNNNRQNQQGFGLGLTIAQRLATKFNLQLDIVFNQTSMVTATLSNR